MAKPTATIRCKAALLQPAVPADATWLFVQLPAAASDKLPTRSMVTVEGTFAGHPVQATLQPDGQGGHWLKVDRALQRAAGVAAGEMAALELAPVAEEPEPQVPDDLHAALS
ncbi:membrane protein, partial [Xanthomonas vesicatoria]